MCRVKNRHRSLRTGSSTLLPFRCGETPRRGLDGGTARRHECPPHSFIAPYTQSCDCLINLTGAYSRPAQANERGASFVPFSLPPRDDSILFPILRDLAEEQASPSGRAPLEHISVLASAILSESLLTPFVCPSLIPFPFRCIQR